MLDGRVKLPLWSWRDAIGAEPRAALVGLIEDSRGVTAIEYALIAALIAVAAIAAFTWSVPTSVPLLVTLQANCRLRLLSGV